MVPDPYESYLRQAEDLFAEGQVVKAGQIWQAILKQQPTHAVARERLLIVKQHLLAQRERAAAQAEVTPPLAVAAPLPAPPGPTPLAPPAELHPHPPAAPPPPPPPPAPLHRVTLDAPDPDRLLAEGCTLYDMGQLEDALHKWERLLALDPEHRLARSYANGARRELGLAALEAPAEMPRPASPQPEGDDDLEKLLREAVQLYDMGLTEEAISKWERVRVLAPERQEVQGYLSQARKELGQLAPVQPTPPPKPTGGTGAEPFADPAAEPEGRTSLELKLRQAEHLLSLQRHEEAAFTFQQALRMAPGDANALAGLERCRKPAKPQLAEPFAAQPPRAAGVSLDPQGRIEMADAPADPARSAEPAPVAPPASLLQTRPPGRSGLPLPDRLKETLERLPWLKNPKVLAGLGGSFIVLVSALLLLRGFLRDQELQRAVKAAKASAVAPLAQQTQIQDLTESPEALREEAQATLGIDPLRAYLRAETLLARTPTDAAAAQLLEKTRAQLPGGVSGASLPEFQKHLQNGDLEAAAKVMDALLRATPSDAGLKARAARLQLLLCSAFVGQGKWEEAREALWRGRALLPADPSWQARLRLLERVKDLPKAQQTGWLPLLG